MTLQCWIAMKDYCLSKTKSLARNGQEICDFKSLPAWIIVDTIRVLEKVGSGILENGLATMELKKVCRGVMKKTAF